MKITYKDTPEKKTTLRDVSEGQFFRFKNTKQYSCTQLKVLLKETDVCFVYTMSGGRLTAPWEVCNEDWELEVEVFKVEELVMGKVSK